MTTRLDVRSGADRTIKTYYVYKGKDGKVRAFPTKGTTGEAAYIAASLMGIREQIDLDGDKIVSGESIQN